MNVETIGMVLAVWSLAGFGFCALWAFGHRGARRAEAAAAKRLPADAAFAPGK